jgi:hypothetical protein
VRFCALLISFDFIVCKNAESHHNSSRWGYVFFVKVQYVECQIVDAANFPTLTEHQVPAGACQEGFR